MGDEDRLDEAWLPESVVVAMRVTALYKTQLLVCYDQSYGRASPLGRATVREVTFHHFCAILT